MKQDLIPKLEVTDIELSYVKQLDERQRRLYLGLKAQTLGHYGVSMVSLAYGANVKTIRKGKKELTDSSLVPLVKIRRAGGGAKKNSLRNLTC